MTKRISRREMLRSGAVAAGVWTLAGSSVIAQSESPNEKRVPQGLDSLIEFGRNP
jgi:hypothetical protein